MHRDLRLQIFLSSTLLFLTLLFFHPDPEDLHSLHTRQGHHDLLRRVDPDPHPDPQRRIRAPDRSGFHICGPAAATADGRHRERAPQRHLSRLWRY